MPRHGPRFASVLRGAEPSAAGLRCCAHVLCAVLSSRAHAPGRLVASAPSCYPHTVCARSGGFPPRDSCRKLARAQCSTAATAQQYARHRLRAGGARHPADMMQPFGRCAAVVAPGCCCARSAAPPAEPSDASMDRRRARQGSIVAGVQCAAAIARYYARRPWCTPQSLRWSSRYMRDEGAIISLL